jgi:hypothetical protein
MDRHDFGMLTNVERRSVVVNVGTFLRAGDSVSFFQLGLEFESRGYWEILIFVRSENFSFDFAKRRIRRAADSPVRKVGIAGSEEVGWSPVYDGRYQSLLIRVRKEFKLTFSHSSEFNHSFLVIPVELTGGLIVTSEGEVDIGNVLTEA